MALPPATPPERAPRELQVPVTPIGGARGGPGRAALVAGLAVVVVIGLAVASSDLFPVGPAPTAPTASDAPVSPVTASPGPLPTAGIAVRITLRIATPPVDVSALVAGVVDGTDPGRLVLIAGHLRASPMPCSSPAPRPGCMLLTIDGLRGLRVLADPAMTVWPGEPAPGSVLVLQERGHDLVYLGSVLVDPSGIENVAGLLARLAGTTPEPVGTLPTIYEADGWLVTKASQTPFLAAEEPAADGSLRIGAGGYAGVSVMPTMPGLDGPDTLTTGPFLLRRRAASDCGQGVGAACFPSPDTWEVVAREDPAHTIRVLLPGS